MSLVKIAPDAWRYYATEIAAGREDYYALAAEHPGRFVGRGAEALGIAGTEVTAEALELLFGRGCDPITGAPLGRAFAPDDDRAVAGFAVTFSPPKTVSVLWATAGHDTSLSVIAAHDAAVTAALSFLDTHAAFTRRGHNGVHQVDTDGLVMASFTHRTSRAADPQLHTHVLVANKVRAADGHWLSLDARELYEQQKAAGMLYKAALRAELTERLGVGWTAVDENGVAEIVGVPEELVERWSSRRRQVEQLGSRLVAEREAARGHTLSAEERAAVFQIAAYRTRTPKVDADTSTAELTARWTDEATAWGHEPLQWLPGVLGREVPDSAPETRGGRNALLAKAVLRLEDSSATWGRADAVEVLSTLVICRDAAGVHARVEMLADELVRRGEVVCLAAPLPAAPPEALRRHDGMFAFERHGAVRFTTEATLRREAAILDAVAKGQAAQVAVVARAIVEEQLARSRLGDDQRDAVRALTTGGEQVALVVGPAGAGKSRALDAARAAGEAAGYRPIGLAPSAMAAGVLAEEARLRTETLAKFLAEVERGRASAQLDARSVVLLDEAAMARTDDLARLVAVTQAAHAKLVLVGDPHQLGAVGPGGVFATLVADHGAAELETVRRFDHAWEAAASLRLRAQDPAILAAYLRHERIAGGSREEMLDRAALAWREARDAGQSVVVTAGDNATAEELSRRVQADRQARGEVERGGVALASGTAGVGDEVVTLRNDRRLRTVPEDRVMPADPAPGGPALRSGAAGDFVRNGDRWQVTDTHPDGSLTVAALDGHGALVLPPAYVAEHVALAYGLTVHKAQGTTTDVAIAVVDQHMTAAQLYVAMSRGRSENRALVVTSATDLDDHAVRRPQLDAVEVLAAVMRRDGVQRSAHDELRRSLATYDNSHLLHDLLEEAKRTIDRGAGPDRSREIDALAPRADVEGATQRLAAAEEVVRLAELRRVGAEEGVAEAEHTSLAARLPGRHGAEARAREDYERRRVEEALTRAQRDETKAWVAYDNARRGLDEARAVVGDVDALRAAQERRGQWLDEHPEEAQWADEIEARLRARSVDRATAAVVRRSRGASLRQEVSEAPARFPSAIRLAAAEEPEMERGEPEVEVEALLRPPSAPSIGYEHGGPYGPQPAPSAAPSGPVLGL